MQLPAARTASAAIIVTAPRAMSQRVRFAAAASGAAALAYVPTARSDTSRRGHKSSRRWAASRAVSGREPRSDGALRREAAAAHAARSLAGRSARSASRTSGCAAAFRYAERPDDAATASVDRYVALARSCPRALDEPGDGGGSRRAGARAGPALQPAAAARRGLDAPRAGAGRRARLRRWLAARRLRRRRPRRRRLAGKRRRGHAVARAPRRRRVVL